MGEEPIVIRCDDLHMGERVAIVLGVTGLQSGLCVFDDEESHSALSFGAVSINECRTLTVCYEEEGVMAAVDLQLIERLGWPIAASNAWPATMRLAPRRQPRSPSADELVYLDACLRALPDFIDSGSDAQTVQVQTGTRPVDLHLLWK